MSDLFAHQEVGAARVAAEPYLWLADELGAGKTRQVVEGACRLYEAGLVERVIVLAPAQVYHDVWSDAELGQIAEFSRVPVEVREHRPRPSAWTTARPGARGLSWTVSNYEYVRNNVHVRPLKQLADERTLLVLDESLAVAGASSNTTRQVWELRKHCGRVVLVNGTEGGGDTPAALYPQAKIMSPDVLGCSTQMEFRARYAVMGGFRVLKWVDKADGLGREQKMLPTQIVDWVNLDDLWDRLRPHYLRRLKTECLDLPPKMPPVSVGVPLSRETWRLYKSMRDDSVAYVEGGRCTAAQAAVRGLRLAQLCSGFLGGVLDLDDEGLPLGDPGLREVGREKLDAVLAWAGEHVGRDAAWPKAVLWCRFRAEAERLARELARTVVDPERVALLIGGLADEKKARAVRMLHPRTSPDGQAVVVGTTRAGQFGLNQAAADKVGYCSNEYSHVARTQSGDRPHRPGQDRPVNYFDFVACGPDGQKTVDHAIIRALRKKARLASWSAADWAQAIREE